MNKLFLSALLALATLPVGAQKYTNPVFDWDTPDPSIQRSLDGAFYCYATACQTRRSTDLVHWVDVPNVFDRPTWNDTTYVRDGQQQTDYYSLWASDVNYVGGRYVMYYASALWGDGSRTGIGVATGTVPYRFTDVGHLFRSSEIGVTNSIDPVFIEEWDKKYLAWGSFNGIYITELTDDGLAVRDMLDKKMIAGNAFEGAMIHKHGNHYYLFASIGSCCDGVNSTYQTVVGRSTRLTGPYMNRTGQLMTNNGYTVVISRNDKWIGPGHNSEIVTDDEGQDWILYHAYDAADASKGRVLLMDRLLWDEQDWPYVEGGSPSFTEQSAPVLHRGDGSRMNYRFVNADFMKGNFAGWTVTENATSALASGLGSAFCPVMQAVGGPFAVEQTCTGMTDGYYEVCFQGFSSQGNGVIRVGCVPTPLIDGRELANLPTTANAVSKAMLGGSFVQRAYGLAVGGRLTIALAGDLASDETLWAGNLMLIRRDKNEEAAQHIRPWYEERARQVVDSPCVDVETKGKLEGYLQNLELATTADARYKALVNIHKQLDQLKALEPLFDGVEEIENGDIRPLRSNLRSYYDLSGRPAAFSKEASTIENRKSGVSVTKGRTLIVR